MGTCASPSATCRCPSLHPDAENAAQASEAEAAQGAFWPMHDAPYAGAGACRSTTSPATRLEAGAAPQAQWRHATNCIIDPP